MDALLKDKTEADARADLKARLTQGRDGNNARAVYSKSSAPGQKAGIATQQKSAREDEDFLDELLR